MNNMNTLYQPYGWCLNQLNDKNRDQTSTATYGNGTNYTDCIQGLIKPLNQIGPENTISVNKLDQYFFNQEKFTPSGANSYKTDYSNTDLQAPRPAETNENKFIVLASNSLHIAPDTLMSIYFSNDNINHLRDSVVLKVKENTKDVIPEGVDIKKPNMDDLFYYMVNIYQNYKIHNGSICFANLRKTIEIKSELIKLNSDVLQEYISKMISQIKMYVYYYKDASQLPQQLSLPVLTSMKGSKTLEYNTGFTSGNSTGVASYNEVGNII